MNRRKSKQLRKTLLEKTAEALVMIRNHYTRNTDIMTEKSVARAFKKMYKRGIISKEFLVEK